jgi:threonine dehydrogenase-like Zn-dependent dehydrogenase
MKGTVLYGPGDVRFEERETPRIEVATAAVIRIAATCVCGSDLWPYRGLQPIVGPTPMGHEYCGVVEEVGGAVRSVRPGQFVVGSFATSDNTCPHCRYGYQSSCMGREFITRAQAPLLRVPSVARGGPGTGSRMRREGDLVEQKGFEPSTPTLRTWCSPS